VDAVHRVPNRTTLTAARAQPPARRPRPPPRPTPPPTDSRLSTDDWNDVNSLSTEAANFSWLLGNFVKSVPGVQHTLVVSADGLLMAMSAELDRTHERLRTEYSRLRDTQWEGKGGYDEWINSGINNAKLLPFGLYRRWVPAFSALFAQHGGDWSAFYSAAAKIARLGAAARGDALSALQASRPD